MANKRLSAVITIGGAVTSAFKSALQSTSARLTSIGGAIRSVEKQQRALAKQTEAYRKAGGDVAALTAEYAKLDSQLAKLRQKQEALIRLEKSRSKLGKAAKDFRGQAGKAVRDVSVAGAAAGWFFKRQFVDTAAEFERFQTILETVEGSSAKAQKSMDWVATFAAKTPYDLAGVTDAFVKLRAYGMDPTNGLLKTLGDTSAAMGKDLMQAVEAIADAVTGENERLKEFGIKARKEGGQITYEYTDKAGRQALAQVDASNREMIESTLTAIFNEKYGGAMGKMSNTWQGMVSNLGDQWTRFTVMVMKNGVFDRMKGRLQSFLDTVDKMAADGTLEKYAKRTADALIKFGEGMYRVGETIYRVGDTLQRLVGGWENLALVMVGLKFAPLIWSAVQLGTALFGMGKALLVVSGVMPMLAAGIKAVGLALVANPIGIAIAAIGAAAFLVWRNWDGIKGGLMLIWDQIGDKVVAVWDVLKTIFSWSPLGLIIRAWQPAIDWIAGKVGWIGDAARAVGRFMGIEQEPKTAAATVAPSPLVPIGQTLPVVVPLAPPAAREDAARAAQPSTSQAQNPAPLPPMNFQIYQQPGEDAQAMAERLWQMIQTKMQQQQRGALFDAGAAYG